MYQYLFWSFAGSAALGLFLLFLRGWESRHDKTRDSFEPLKWGLCTVFAVPYVALVLILAIFSDLNDIRRKLGRK